MDRYRYMDILNQLTKGRTLTPHHISHFKKKKKKSKATNNKKPKLAYTGHFDSNRPPHPSPYGHCGLSLRETVHLA